MGADFRRFRIGSYSNDFAARGDATRTRGSPAVPHWGFFRFLCRAGLRRFRIGVSSGSFAARGGATQTRGSPAVSR